MMIDALFVDEQIILAATVPMCSVTAAMNLATLHKTAPTRFLPQECQATKTGIIPGHNTPTPEGTGHTPPTMDADMGDISAGHSHTAISTMTGAAAVTEGKHYTPHPANTVACATFWLMDVSNATHAMTHQW